MNRMEATDDRRENRRHTREELSPEYLAVLVLCGGEVRESDRPVLNARNNSTDEEAGRGDDGKPAQRR
jgi:hypothetical protein